jgi:hypothetical protein
MSIQRKIKRLLCQHIYKCSSKEFLRREREPYGIKWGVPTYADFEYYAESQRCIICGHERLVERKLIL